MKVNRFKSPTFNLNWLLLLPILLSLLFLSLPYAAIQTTARPFSGEGETSLFMPVSANHPNGRLSNLPTDSNQAQTISSAFITGLPGTWDEVLTVSIPDGESAENLLVFLQNHQSSVVGTTEPSNPLLSKQLFAYLAYGEPTGTSPESLPLAGIGYTGRQHDDTGLMYYRGRYRDSCTGSFIQEDPKRDGINWYGYVGGDPVNMVDPAGYEQFFHNDLANLFSNHNIPVIRNPPGDPDVPDFNGLDNTQRQAFVQDLANLIHQRAGLEDVGVAWTARDGAIAGGLGGLAANKAAIAGFSRGLFTGGVFGGGIGLAAGALYHQVTDRRCGKVQSRTEDAWGKLVGGPDGNPYPLSLGDLRYRGADREGILGKILGIAPPIREATDYLYYEGAEFINGSRPDAPYYRKHKFSQFGIGQDWYTFDPWLTGNTTITPEP